MKLDIKNFRSIKDQSVELAPITVLYGPNGSGKSSLLYSLLIMKNVILHLERQTGDFFNLDFANLVILAPSFINTSIDRLHVV